MENIEIFRKKLLYKASHRGTKEMDILMGNFADKFIQLFDDYELSLLDILLDQDDDHIYKIILKKNNIDCLKSTSLWRRSVPGGAAGGGAVIFYKLSLFVCQI